MNLKTKFLLVLLIFPLFILPGCQFLLRKEVKISDSLHLIRLSEKAYIHISYYDYGRTGLYPANGLVLFDKGKAFLFDTPPTDSLTKQLVAWISGTMHSTLVGFMPNHWHNDCMGGLGYLKSIGVTSYANRMTIDIARSKNLPVPDYGFGDIYQFRFGNENIECYYPGAGHAKDNIVVWVPGEKILFAGCMCKDMKSTGLGNTADADLHEWPKSIRRVIIKYPDVRIVIPGHGPSGGPELLEHTFKLLSERKFQALKIPAGEKLITQQ